MINADYSGAAGASHGGTRSDAQSEAAALLVAGKLQANPESAVGLLAYGGRAVRVLSAPADYRFEATLLAHLTGPLAKPDAASSASSTAPSAKVAAAVSATAATTAAPGGLVAALKTAFLALKHRRNKMSAQRIVAFVASPVEADAAELKRVAAAFKKNNVRRAEGGGRSRGVGGRAGERAARGRAEGR
jgi:26S proteasome regulatory subunit N10